MYSFLSTNKHTNEYSSTSDIVIDNKTAKEKNHCVATDVFSIFCVLITFAHVYVLHYCAVEIIIAEILCMWVKVSCVW